MYPTTFPKVQLIIGLPGQTVETWRNTLREVSKNQVYLIIFTNEILPASPAVLNKEYQTKFNFEYSTSQRYAGVDGRYIYGKFPKSCVSFTQEQFVEMILLSTIYTSLTTLRNESTYPELIDIEVLVDAFLKSAEYTVLYNNLLNNWINEDKFYYTQTFGGNNMIVSACHIPAAAGDWIREIAFAKFLTKHIEVKSPGLIKEILNWENRSHWEKYDTIN
jgi:hypothetical protein